MLASLRPMVISSRTTGMTVLRPSSSSMMSFMEVPSKVRQAIYRTLKAHPKRLVTQILVNLRAVGGAEGQVFLQPFHGVRSIRQVGVPVPETAIPLRDGRF